MLRSIFSLTLLTFAATTATATPVIVPTTVPWGVASVELQEVPDTGGSDVLIENDCSKFPTTSDMTTIGWDEVVALGEKVWKIVEAGKPVVTVQTPEASALPRGLACWADLSGWQAPQTKAYEVVYKNGFGMDVVKFRFRLQFTAGGGHDGIGKYLANVTVMPAELNVMWGYTFDAQVEVEQAINVGSSQNPIAGLELNLKWDVKTVVQESVNSFHFFVQGDGVTSTAN